ncbi:hypothetical protein [Streptomyces sp. NBRC 110028]|uniref:hypothetical protein n=1 Tax=Streptomyces sp. NBRC 110028 TaxID=1621260 RepID=UPI0006E433A4|nr:hypothetical protein [Streptomyces sp. NBRC 110028]
MTAPTPSARVPLADHGLPLLGHLVPMLRAPGLFAAAAQTGEVVRVQLGPRSLYFVTSPRMTHS